jgi:hypothetical protein
MEWRSVRRRALLMIWKSDLAEVGSCTVRLGEVVIRMKTWLQVGESQHDRKHWVLDQERQAYMVCYFGVRLVDRERRAPLRRDLYHRQRPVEEVFSRGVLWARELEEQLGCRRAEQRRQDLGAWQSHFFPPTTSGILEMAIALQVGSFAELLSVVEKVVVEVDSASCVFDRLGTLGLTMPHSRDSVQQGPHPHGAALPVLAALLRQYPIGMGAVVS